MPQRHRLLLPILAILPLLPSLAAAQAIQDIAVGEQHACTLDDAGSVNCFTETGAAILVATDSLPALTDIAAGQQHTCGITLDGGAECWGRNHYGELDVPVLQAPLVSLAAGANHTCAVDTNADVICWGLNTNLQLAPPAIDRGFSQVEAAFNFSCGLLLDGSATCWTTDSRYNTPEPIAGPFTDIDVSSSNSCGLTSAGEISCWSSSLTRAAAPPSNGPYVDMVVTKRGVICGLTPDGRLDCAFRNNESDEIRAEFTTISEQVRFTAIESGDGFGGGSFGAPTAPVCGIRADDGSLLCFGSVPLRNLNSPADSDASGINLNLSALAHDQFFIELFWNRQDNQNPPVSFEIFRDGTLFTTTNAQFSFIDNERVTETESIYSVRAIDTNGNTGPFSNEVTVSREFPGVIENSTDASLNNPRENNSLRIENLSLAAIGSFNNQAGTILVTWDALTESDIALAGYEIRVNNETVAFTRNTVFLRGGFGREFCGVVSVLAIGDDGQILETASAAMIIPQFRRTCG